MVDFELLLQHCGNGAALPSGWHHPQLLHARLGWHRHRRPTTRADRELLRHRLLIRAVLSAIIIVAVSEIARRNAGTGALLSSLPLISVLGMIWLWRDTQDVDRMAAHAQATFWYVLPSLPMFLLIPLLLKRGVDFWPALTAGCVLTTLRYFGMTAMLSRFRVIL